MVRSLWKTLAVGAFAWLLAPSAPAQTPQHDPSPQSNTYQRDSATTRTTTHESSTVRRGSSVSDDTTKMDHAKKSRKHKSMEMKHSKKAHKSHKGSGAMEDSSSSIHHRGSGDMMDKNEQKRHSGTTMDTSSTRHRGNMDYERSGAGDTSGWNNRNRSDYPQGTSGGNTQKVDSIRHRGNVGGDSAGFNDRNNSATMDTVMSGSDSSRINRRGGTINDNTNWNSTSDSLNRWSDSVRHRGSLDSSYQDQHDSSSHRGGIYHRGAIRDSAGNPEMNNPELDRSNPDMNRSKDGMRDSSRVSPPEQRDDNDSLHHSMSMNNASTDKMALATYSYQEKDSYDRQDTSKSGSWRHSGTQRRGGMDKESKNEDMNNNNNTSSEFSGSFKASLVNADTKAMKGEATVKVTVNGIKIVDPAEMNEKVHKGEGHIHYQLDDGPEIATTALKLSFHKLSAGEHTIKVMLAGNDHNPLGPQETLKVTVPEHGQE